MHFFHLLYLKLIMYSYSISYRLGNVFLFLFVIVKVDRVFLFDLLSLFIKLIDLKKTDAAYVLVWTVGPWRC